MQSLRGNFTWIRGWESYQKGLALPLGSEWVPSSTSLRQMGKAVARGEVGAPCFPASAACQACRTGKDVWVHHPLQAGKGRGWILSSVSAGPPSDQVLTEQEVGQKGVGGCLGANVTLREHLLCATAKEYASISSHNHPTR